MLLFLFCCFNSKCRYFPLFLAHSLTFRFQLFLLQFQDLLRFRIQFGILHLFPHFTLYLFRIAPNLFYISSLDRTTYRFYKSFLHCIFILASIYYHINTYFPIKIWQSAYHCESPHNPKSISSLPTVILLPVQMKIRPVK